MRRTALLLWLLPCLASAQVAPAGGVTVSEASDRPDEIVNLAECLKQVAANFTLSFTLQQPSALQTRVELYVSDTTNCPLASDNTVAKTVLLQTFSGASASGTTGILSVDALLRTSPLAVDCSTDIILQLCAFGLDASGARIAGASATGTLPVDVVLPGQPTINSIDPGDGALRVRWTSVAGADHYRVQATPVGGGNPRSEETDANDLRMTGLTNGTLYEVVVFAVSEGGNEGTGSPPAQLSPVEVNDFWRLYRSAGGSEQGGCGVGGAGSLALLALLPLVLRRRRP